MPQNHLEITKGNWCQNDERILPEGYEDILQEENPEQEIETIENQWCYRWHDSGFGYCTDNEYCGPFETALEAFEESRRLFENWDDEEEEQNWDKYEKRVKDAEKADSEVREKLDKILK